MYLQRPPKNETDSFPNNDEDGKRYMSVSNIRRSTTPSTADRTQFDSLSRRSNSTGAAFMARAKQRSASGLSTRLNRHSMVTTLGENGRDIVVSRPPSPRQPSADMEDSSRASQPKLKSPTKAKLERENSKSNAAPNGHPPISNSGITQHNSTRKEKPDILLPEAVDTTSSKGKVRRRLSTLFGIFHRKQDTH
jgi:hypothetical protein